MYAIVGCGGKQYKVEKDMLVKVEKIDAEVGAKVELEVLMFVDDKGSVKAGADAAKVKVEAVVNAQGKFPKVDVFHYITGVTCTGHTGYAEQGEDIVCAAVSSVVQTAVLGLMQLVGVNVDYKVDEKEGFLSAALPEKLTAAQRHDSDLILRTAYLGVSDLYEGFSDFINLEVE